MLDDDDESLQMTPQDTLQRQGMPETEDESLQMKPQGIIQRQCTCGKNEDVNQEQPVIQKKGKEGSSVPTKVASEIQHAKGQGQALEPHLQQRMGKAMGADFSGVRVHTDAQSDQLNDQIQAKAFTTGQDVFFKQGAYQPGSRDGQTLIAHELTHVVQQQPETATQESTQGFSPQGRTFNQEGIGQSSSNMNTEVTTISAQAGTERLLPINHIQRMITKAIPYEKKDVTASIIRDYWSNTIINKRGQTFIAAVNEFIDTALMDKKAFKNIDLKAGNEKALSVVRRVKRLKVEIETLIIKKSNASVEEASEAYEKITLIKDEINKHKKRYPDHPNKLGANPDEEKKGTIPNTKRSFSAAIQIRSYYNALRKNQVRKDNGIRKVQVQRGYYDGYWKYGETRIGRYGEYFHRYPKRKWIEEWVPPQWEYQQKYSPCLIYNSVNYPLERKLKFMLAVIALPNGQYIISHSGKRRDLRQKLLEDTLDVKYSGQGLVKTTSDLAKPRQVYTQEFNKVKGKTKTTATIEQQYNSFREYYTDSSGKRQSRNKNVPSFKAVNDPVLGTGNAIGECAAPAAIFNSASELGLNAILTQGFDGKLDGDFPDALKGKERLGLTEILVEPDLGQSKKGSATVYGEKYTAKEDADVPSCVTCHHQLDSVFEAIVERYWNVLNKKVVDTEYQTVDQEKLKKEFDDDAKKIAKVFKKGDFYTDNPEDGSDLAKQKRGQAEAKPQEQIAKIETTVEKMAQKLAKKYTQEPQHIERRQENKKPTDPTETPTETLTQIEELEKKIPMAGLLARRLQYGTHIAPQKYNKYRGEQGEENVGEVVKTLNSILGNTKYQQWARNELKFSKLFNSGNKALQNWKSAKKQKEQLEGAKKGDEKNDKGRTKWKATDMSGAMKVVEASEAVRSILNKLLREIMVLKEREIAQKIYVEEFPPILEGIYKNKSSEELNAIRKKLVKPAARLKGDSRKVGALREIDMILAEVIQYRYQQENSKAKNKMEPKDKNKKVYALFNLYLVVVKGAENVPTFVYLGHGKPVFLYPVW